MVITIEIGQSASKFPNKEKGSETIITLSVKDNGIVQTTTINGLGN